MTLMGPGAEYHVCTSLITLMGPQLPQLNYIKVY